jgi:hypothetical protein
MPKPPDAGKPPKPEPPPEVPEQVRALLQASVLAHRHAQRMRKDHDWTGARLKIEEAKALRQQAHELDPDRCCPPWQVDQGLTPQGYDTHIELMRFYERYLL